MSGKPPPSPGTRLPRHDSGLAGMSSSSDEAEEEEEPTETKLRPPPSSTSSTSSPKIPNHPPTTTTTPTTSNPNDLIIFNTTPFSPTSTQTPISLPDWLSQLRLDSTPSGCEQGREWLVRTRSPLSWEDRMALRPLMRSELRWGVTPSVVPRRGGGGDVGAEKEDEGRQMPRLARTRTETTWEGSGQKKKGRLERTVSARSVAGYGGKIWGRR